MKKGVIIFALTLLAACVDGTPVTPEMMCSEPDTVSLTDTTKATVCLEPPPIQTTIER